MNDNAASQDVDFSRFADLGDGIIPMLDALREQHPIFWSEKQKGWIVSRHADVLDGFSGRLPLKSERLHGQFVYQSIPSEEREARIPRLSRYVPHWPINMDAPQHTRIRKLITRAFNRRIVEGLRTFARERIGHVLDEAVRRGEVEYVEEVCRRIPASIILKLLGLDPDVYFEHLKRWAATLTDCFSTPSPSPALLDLGEASLREMNLLLTEEIARRRLSPGDDFISQLVIADEGGGRLSDDEILGICQVTIVAGQDTTTNSLALGTLGVMQNLADWQRMVEQSNIDSVITELLRYISMSVCQTRIAGAEFEWHGERIKAGDIIYLMISSANRDPRAFPDPAQLSLKEGNAVPATFGPGLHHCVGHLLARMQLGEFFPKLVEKFASVEILDDKLSFNSSFSFRGLDHLHLRLWPRAAHSDAGA